MYVGGRHIGFGTTFENKMAAPTIQTPCKQDKIKCVFCSSSVLRLHCLNNNKCRSANSHNILTNLIKVKDASIDIEIILNHLFLCCDCIDYITNLNTKTELLYENVRQIIQNVKRTKRGLLSPRQKVSDQILLSVEKLKQLKLTVADKAEHCPSYTDRALKEKPHQSIWRRG
ncbi:hypothetical protein DPMN_138254 [Dreissena polymorpha]|uniref:ZAD domain-containing protein n=1 Tax=Dreissena polymorpha TaxID=45954 RepID=A0A9D4CA38_DREPO|nr:hypothetical protein DPMN_063224 [Dreissena polymorpha]KAH3809874.1 hypothetical protein DPMN_138254 [Dreissena polymorpha]